MNSILALFNNIRRFLHLVIKIIAYFYGYIMFNLKLTTTAQCVLITTHLI